MNSDDGQKENNCWSGTKFLHETVWNEANFWKQNKMSCLVAVNAKKVLAKCMIDVLINKLYRSSNLNNTRHASAGFDLIRAPRRVSYFLGFV